MGPSARPRNALAVTRPAYDVTNPRYKFEMRLQDKTPQGYVVLTLKCGHNTPDSDHCRQKELWTNLSEKKAGREVCSDIWPSSIVETPLQHFRAWR